jgi:hypothetical protein
MNIQSKMSISRVSSFTQGSVYATANPSAGKGKDWHRNPDDYDKGRPMSSNPFQTTPLINTETERKTIIYAGPYNEEPGYMASIAFIPKPLGVHDALRPKGLQNDRVTKRLDPFITNRKAVNKSRFRRTSTMFKRDLAQKEYHKFAHAQAKAEIEAEDELRLQQVKAVKMSEHVKDKDNQDHEALGEKWVEHVKIRLAGGAGFSEYAGLAIPGEGGAAGAPPSKAPQPSQPRPKVVIEDDEDDDDDDDDDDMNGVNLPKEMKLPSFDSSSGAQPFFQRPGVNLASFIPKLHRIINPAQDEDAESDTSDESESEGDESNLPDLEDVAKRNPKRKMQSFNSKIKRQRQKAPIQVIPANKKKKRKPAEEPVEEPINVVPNAFMKTTKRKMESFVSKPKRKFKPADTKRKVKRNMDSFKSKIKRQKK